jgi:hypothetical protein
MSKLNVLPWLPPHQLYVGWTSHNCHGNNEKIEATLETISQVAFGKDENP